MKYRKRGSGGFLNDVNGTITGYNFETKEWEKKNPKKGQSKTYETLTLGLTIRPDGAEEDVQQFLPCGFFYSDTAQVSEDGQTITGLDDEGNEEELTAGVIDEGSEAEKFLTSLFEAAEGSDVEIDVPDTASELSALVGLRVTFGKVANRDRQIEIGRARLLKDARTASEKQKAKAATEDEAFEAGKDIDKKDKTKSYNIGDLVVTAVLGREDGGKKKGGKAASKPAAKTVSAKPAGKVTAGKKKADDGPDPGEVLVAILNEAPKNMIQRAQVSGRVVAWCAENGFEDGEDGSENPVRESLRKTLFDEKFLKTEEGWTYTVDGKKQTIALAESD